VVRLNKHTNIYPVSHAFAVKHWIRQNWRRVQVAEYPEIALLESSAVVTPEKSRGWFIHSGYNVM
jgi:hypothetical protein